MIRDTSIVTAYAAANPEGRINLILDNFLMFESILNGLELFLIRELQDIIESEHIKGFYDRVQSSTLSDHTADLALRNINIREFLNSNYRLSFLVKDHDNIHIISDKVTIYRRMRKDYDVIAAHLIDTKSSELNLFYSYIQDSRCMKEIAADNDLDYEVYRKQIYRIKRLFISSVLFYFNY